MIPFLFFCLGASVGSFMGLIWDRFPEKSIIWPPSHCHYCKNPLRPYQLIPVLSLLITGFKCYFCKRKVSLLYSFLEGAMGFLFVCAYYELAVSWLDVYIISFSCLLSLYDLRTHSYPFSIWLLFFSGLLLTQEWNLLVLIFLLLAMACTLYPISIGNGDFLYLASLALVYDLRTLLWIIQIACLLGLVFCASYKKRNIPFLPFLSLALLSVLFLKP